MQCFKRNEAPEEVTSNKVLQPTSEIVKSSDLLMQASGNSSAALNIPNSSEYTRKKFVKRSRSSVSNRLELSGSDLDGSHSSYLNDNVANKC